MIAWSSSGAGPALLLLEAPGRDWDLIADRLATMHRVLRVGGDDLSDAVDVLDAAGVPAAIVVGGTVAASIAIRRPARVAALILLPGWKPDPRLAQLHLPSLWLMTPGAKTSPRPLGSAEVAVAVEDSLGFAQTLLDFTATL